MSIIKKTNIYSTALNILFIGLFSALFLDLGTNLYNLIMGLPLNDFAVIGRYALYTLQGHIITSPINEIPVMQHEVVVGWMIHFMVSFVYAFFYVLFVEKGLFLKPSFKKGIVYAWVLLVFPLIVLSLALGDGIFHDHNPHMIKVILFSVFAHTCYGIGLYVTATILYHARLELFKQN